MQVLTSFAERLFYLRRHRGLEQTELADQVGLTNHQVGRLERGQITVIRIEALRHLARVLGVTTDWLLAMDMLEAPPTAEQLEEGLSTPRV